MATRPGSPASAAPSPSRSTPHRLLVPPALPLSHAPPCCDGVTYPTQPGQHRLASTAQHSSPDSQAWQPSLPFSPLPLPAPPRSVSPHLFTPQPASPPSLPLHCCAPSCPATPRPARPCLALFLPYPAPPLPACSALPSPISLPGPALFICHTVWVLVSCNNKNLA